MIRRSVVSILVIVSMLSAAHGAYAQSPSKPRVILISIDGLRSDAITTLGPKELPNLHLLISQGASTFNARTDPDMTVTLPNHICMLTGRGVKGERGHGYTDNKSPDLSIHENKGGYIDSVFDVVKDHGGKTAMFASKLKFQVFINSYGKVEKVTRPSKIDIYRLTDQNDAATMKSVLGQINVGLTDFTFVHFASTDHVGHTYGWELAKRSRYTQALKLIDRYIGRLLDAVSAKKSLAGSVVVIVTSDHGGTGKNHQDVTKLEDFRIPFIIWGKGVAGGGDLYTINKDSRRDPGQGQVAYGQGLQPVRNGDAANLACAVLGLPPVPGSMIGNPDVLKFQSNN